MDKPCKVYVAYRYSCDGKVVNILNSIGRATRVGVELARLGYYPYVPHLDWLMSAMDGAENHPALPLEYYYSQGIAWLNACDCMLLVDANDVHTSVGVKREYDYCKANGIPMFYNIPELEYACRKTKP